MNSRKYGKGILSKKKGLAIAISLIAIAGSLFFIDNAKASTDPLPIVGTVYDTDGITPVAGATVIIRDTITGAWGMNVTDANGNYSITLGGLARPWTVWYDGDWIVGTATLGGQTGKNATNIDQDYYNASGRNWLNITLGTPETTKTIGEPQFIKYDYNDSSSNYGYLISEPIHIDGPTATLSFWTWWQIESWDPDFYDLMNVSVSTDGGYNWNLVDTLNPNSAPAGASDGAFYGSSGFNVEPQWVHMTYDLSSYVGENVTLKFEFNTVDYRYNDWEGWYIDDISLAGFSDDVESGTVNWTYTGYWHITDHRSYSGSHSWYYGIEKSYVSNTTEFNMTATGDYDNITYRIWWNGTWSSWTNYTGNFTLGDNECKHYLEFYAENGTNSEPVRNQTHYVDTSYPESTYEFGEPTANLSYGGYNYTAIKSGTPLWINATDDVGAGCFAGVEWLNYSVWWNSTAPNNYDQLYEVSVHDNDANDTDKRVGYISVKLIFNEECFHEIKWQMVDYLGHESPQHSIDISVDTTAPTIVEQVGEPKYVDGNGRTWVNCSTPIWFNITDSGCGGGVGVWQFGINVYWNETQVPPGEEQLFDLIDTIVVEDNGPLDLNNKTGEISYKFTFSQDCFHEPEIWAMDYVGNTYLYKEKFLVDCTPPAIEKRIPKVVALEQTQMNNFSWVNNTVNFQSFLAPWSYMDAVQVHVCGYFDEPLYVYIYDNITGQYVPLANGSISVDDIPINETGYYCGWLQIHLSERLYTEHGKQYWLELVAGSSGVPLVWNASDNDPYAGGNASINGVFNDSWDFTFKIEYYPIVVKDGSGSVLSDVYNGSYLYALFNETVSWDGLNGTWITSQAFFNLDSWDEGCMDGVGLDSLQYRIWWNGSWSEWMNYTQPFNLPDECKHYIEIKAVDLLGNERIINQTHYVDNSPPELRVEYPDVHGFYYDEQEGKQYVRAGKTFYLNLTDMPDSECAVGWHNFTFYWRYEYTNFTTPYIEQHPANESDTEYPGELVYINGNWWWKVDVTGDPSIALSFDRECMHTIYYFYNATDWLDNEVHSGVQEEVIYVDENGPEIEKEHPPCYYDEDWIYLHPDNWGKDNPWDVPDWDEWVAYYNWTQLYPVDEFGREYEGTYDGKFGYYYDMNNNGIADDGDYIELVDTQYGVHRLYLIENLTITLEIYNETLNETKYVEFTGYYDGFWTFDFSILQINPLGSLWHEVYPTFSNMYNLTWSDDPLSVGTTIMLNDTETDEWHNWTIMDATWDLILDPVPFIQKCGKINLTAHDTPEILKLVDQFQNVGSRADELQLRENILQWPWDAQSFQVSENISAINEIWLWLDWDGLANVTVYLHNDGPFTPGTELGMSTVTLTGNSTGEWVKFVFDPAIPVTPGVTYAFDAFRENGSMVHWFHADNDVYANGVPYISSEQSEGDWMFAVVAYRPNPCASGIEGIYYGYEFNGTFHPNSMDDNVSTYGQVINISQYYSDEEIRTNFSGHYLWYVYNNSIGVHFHEECIHWLYYWTKDNVCHHTPVYMQVYHVDEYNPVVEKFLRGHGYYTPVSIEVDDTFVNASYQYNGTFHVRNEWYDYSSAPDGWLPNPSGQYVDKYQVVDFTITNNDLNKDLHLKLHVNEIVGDEGITLENGSDVNEKVYTITVPADSTVVYPIYVYDNIEFLRWGVWQWWAEIENVTQYLKAGKQIPLRAYDPGYCASGVENIYYRYVWNNTMYPPAGHPAAVNGSTLSNEPEIANYWWYIYNDSTDIVFNEECKHELYYFAKDRICHNSTVHHETYYVDASPPIINETLPEHGAIGNTTQSLFEHFYIPFGNGWAVVNGSTSYWELKSDEPYLDYIYHDIDTSHYGYYSAMAWKDSGSADSWLITPKVTIPEDGNLSFWYATYSGYDASFEVCVNNMSTQTDTSAFVQVWNSGVFGDSTFRKTEIDLHQYAGQEVYIGFHCTYLENPYYTGGLLIDDVWVGGIHRVETLLDDDVEDGANWTIDDLTVTQDSYWSQVDRIPVYLMDSPAPSMNCYDGSLGNGNDGFGQYDCNWNDVLKLKNPINLSDANGSDDIWFDFMLWHQLGSGDTLYVEVSIDNENWTELASYTGDSGAWLTPHINLSDYRGNATVWIRFRFVSDDSGLSGDAGAFIDNVTIYNSTYTWIYDTFDSPWTNWVASMLETSMWHIVADSEYHSFNHSWWNGNDSAGTYLSCVDDALVSPIYDLSGYSYEKVTLTFWHYRELSDYWDYGILEYRYSNDGSTWTNWNSAAYYHYSRDWVQEFVDLNVGHPQKVQFRFRFISDSDTYKYGGWYIDDIHLELRNITETTFEDDFEKTFPPAGWSKEGNYVSNHLYGWSHYQTPEYTIAAIHTYQYYNQDEWLETPVIHNLPKFSNLTFKHNLSTPDPYIYAYLYIKVDNGSWQYLTQLGDTIGYETIDISLWQYYGHDVQLAFRFVANYGYGDLYHDYWAIEWVNITSIGFLREGAPIHLDVTDQPLNSDCDVGVESIFWRYEENGYRHPGDVYDGYDVISGDRLFELYGEDYNISDIRDYDWYVVNDTTSLNITFGEECVHDLYYFAKDNVCHRTAIFHERYYVDGTAPETWFNISWGNHPWIPRNGNGEGIKVAIYDSDTYGPGSYFDGAEGNNYNEFSDVLTNDPEGRFYVDVITTLDYATLQNYDVLVLPDNGVPDQWVDDVNSWFTEGKRIVAGDSSVCFAAYSGYLWPGAAGTNGEDTYWDYYSGYNDQRIEIAHPITSGYTVGQIISSVEGDAQMYRDMLPADAVVLTVNNTNSSNAYAVYRDVPGKGSIVVLGVYDTLYPDEYNLIREACAWNITPSPLPIPEYYTPENVSSGDAPDVICINDDVHFYADHYGSEPCIYPYNHQNNTYYRWEWWNNETKEFEFWPTPETPGAINGSSITVSSNADHIQYNDNPSFWHYQTPPAGGYIWWMPYTEPFYFTEGCNHTLFYFSKDDLCNTEQPNEWYVGVDDKAPETTLEFNSTDGCIWYNDTYNTWYFQDGTLMGINATDLPNNTYCRTGIWKMEYTVWRWNSSQFDIQIVSNELPGTWTSTPVYIDGSYVGYAYLYVDNDGDGNWSVGDYMYIEWNYGVDYTDGWYRISSMAFDGIFELTIQDVFGGAGDWDVLVPWETVYPGSMYNTHGGNVKLTWGYNYTWATLWLDVGGLNEYFYPEDSNNNCGKYEIHWRVYDYNNMTVGERKQDVDIDCTLPRTTKEFSQPVKEEQISGGEVIHWVNPATTKIWLNGTDNFMWDSGVAETWYKFWEEDPILLWKLNNDTFEQPNYPGVNSTSKNWFTIDEAAQIMGYEDAADYFAHNPNVAESQGIIELYHWSKDRVCHIEDWNESKQHIYVDDMPPTSMVQNITPYQRETVPFNITVVNITDHGYEDSGPVGVCKVELYYSYSKYNVTFGDWTLYATYNVPWNERNNVPNWTLSFDAPEGAGYYHFRSIAYDCVNNVETGPFAWYPEDYDARCLVLADTEPPVVTKEYGSPVVPIDIGGESGHAITSSTPIWINATDMPEEDWWGVDKIMWNFDGTEWQESPSFNGAHMANYSITPGEYNLSEGVHTIFFKATDMLGHVSDEGKQKFLVDNTPPESYVNDITPYNQSMPVEITGEATDSVGVSEVALYYRYSTDNSTWSDWMLYGTDDTAPYNWSFIIAPDPGYYKPGYYQFYSVATDMLGNQEALPTNETTPDAECYVAPIPSDLNGDGRVNIFDVAIIGQHWGETPEGEGWNPSVDLNGDGVINVGDIVVLGQNWTG